MSTSTVRGTIQNFSPKPDEGYYGILVDTGKEEKWLNGNGDVPEDLEKGDKVKIEANTNGFIEINSIEVVGSGSKQSSGRARGNSSDMDAQSAGDGAGHESHIPKSKRIMLQCAFKKAVDESSADAVKSQGKHLDQVSELTNGYYNLLEAQINDKAENRGDQ